MKFNVIASEPTEGVAHLEFSERGIVYDAFMSFFEAMQQEQLPYKDDHKEKIKIGAELLLNEMAQSETDVIRLGTHNARLVAEVIEDHFLADNAESLERIANLARGFREASERLALNPEWSANNRMTAAEIDREVSLAIIPGSPAGLVE